MCCPTEGGDTGGGGAQTFFSFFVAFGKICRGFSCFFISFFVRVHVASPHIAVVASGIQGQNQVITVGDTGLDYYSLYFRDNSDPTFDGVPGSHRKVLSRQSLQIQRLVELGTISVKEGCGTEYFFSWVAFLLL